VLGCAAIDEHPITCPLVQVSALGRVIFNENAPHTWRWLLLAQLRARPPSESFLCHLTLALVGVICLDSPNGY
jgi:hypothetical protein